MVRLVVDRTGHSSYHPVDEDLRVEQPEPLWVDVELPVYGYAIGQLPEIIGVAFLPLWQVLKILSYRVVLMGEV